MLPFQSSTRIDSATGSEKVTYAGEIKDDPSGLFYLFARYYDPETGRFVSLDPELGSLSSPQTLNRYAYCVNNPLKYTDPDGRFIFLFFLFMGLFALGMGTVNAAVAATTGGDVGAAFVGGAIEGALLLTPAAPFAGTIGGTAQCLLEDGSIDASDAVFIGMASLPGPNFGQGARPFLKSFVKAGAENAGDVAERQLYEMVPDAYMESARKLSKRPIKEIDELMNMPLRPKHRRLSDFMHDTMAEMAEGINIKNTKRGHSGADFYGDDWWLDLSTHNTWPKPPKVRAKYDKLYGGGGKPIYYDPGEVLNYYERYFRK